MAEAMELEVMSKEHRAILRKNRAVLERDLQAVQVLQYLTDVLTQEDEEEVKAEKTPTGQARTLLDILPRKGNKALLCFITGLNNVQPHLAVLLSNEAGLEKTSSFDENDKHMSPELINKLRSSRELLKEIDLNTILNPMKEVLTKTDMELIKSKATNDEKWEEFLSVLPKKGLKAFDHFVSILRSKRYNHIANHLEGKASHKEDETDKRPVQVVTHPVHDTPVSKIKHKLDAFYSVTNGNSCWKWLAQEFQLQDNYLGKHNPTYAIVNDWSVREGDNANLGTLLQALTKGGYHDSKQCLEKLLHPNEADVIDAPSTVDAIMKRTANLSIVPVQCQTVAVPKRLKDLKDPDLLEQLREIVLEEMKLRNCPQSSIDIQDIETIRGLTKILRRNGLTDSILWMKKHLPAGVTGPLLEETTNIRDMRYKVRSQLTLQLSVDSRWKLVADRLGIEQTKINYFDQRSKNPADEVLKDWETKRNSTVGDLYDILVELDMPVIADTL